MIYLILGMVAVFMGIGLAMLNIMHGHIHEMLDLLYEKLQ